MLSATAVKNCKRCRPLAYFSDVGDSIFVALSPTALKQNSQKNIRPKHKLLKIFGLVLKSPIHKDLICVTIPAPLPMHYPMPLVPFGTAYKNSCDLLSCTSAYYLPSLPQKREESGEYE
jgi:hypothetical protein